MANLLSWLGGAAKKTENFAANNIVKPVYRGVVTPTVNQAAGLGAGLAGFGAASVGALTHNPVAEQNAIRNAQATMQHFNQHAWYNPAAPGAGGGGYIAKKALSTGAQVAPYFVGNEAAGLVEKPLAKIGLAALGQGVVNAGSSAATQKLSGQKVNWDQVKKAGISAAALGGLAQGAQLVHPAASQAIGNIQTNRAINAAKNNNWNKAYIVNQGSRAKVGTPADIPLKGPKGGIAVTKSILKNERGSIPIIGGDGSGPKLTSQEANALAKEVTAEPATPKIPTGKKTLGVVKTIQDSPQTTPELAKITGSYNPKANKVAMAAASKRIAQDPGAAYQFAVTTHSAEGNATAIQLAKQLESQGKSSEAANLAVTKAQQALQAGQGNQIYGMWDKLSPETVAQTAAKTIEKYNATAKKPISQLSAEQYQGFVDAAKNLQSLPEGSRARGMAQQDLLKSIGQLVPSSKGDKAFALYRTGLLTGFRTPGKILASHTGSSLLEQAKNAPATLADQGISLVTGKRSMSLTARGNIAGAKGGTFAGVDNLLHGYEAPGTGGFQRDFANDTHFDTSTWHGKIAQNYVDTVTRLHGSLYKPFYGAQHLNSLYDMALTNAKNQGLKGAEKEAFVSDFVKKATDVSIKNPTPDIHGDISTPEGAASRAIAEAQYTTFQNKTKLGDIAAGAKRGKGNPTRYVAPFTQIPSSVAMKIVDYSPVGPVKEAIQQIHAGNFDQRALSQAIGRGVTGTGVMALGKALWDAGHVTTAYPTDPKEQAQWKLEGKQANSVLVGGKWRSLASLGPAGDAIAVGANFAEGLKGNPKTPGNLTNAGIQGGIGGEQVIAASPYLQSLQNIGQAISSPGTKAQKLTEGLAGGLIPTGVANVATATDPLQRQTNSVGNAITNKIPIAREGNLPQIDVLGNKVPRAQGAVGSLIDPFYSSSNNSSPVINELQRLDDNNANSTPSPLKKNQTIVGQKVNLDPQQLTKLQQDTGLPIGQQFQQLMSTPEYKNADDATKQQALGDIVTGVRSQANINLAQGDSGGSSGSASGQINLNKLSTKAQLTLAKDSFDKSGKSYQVVGDTVLRRDAQGNITATPKVKYDYQVGAATLVSQKNNGDLSGWLTTAKSQLDSIAKQLQDPSIDPLDALTLQNDASALQNNIAKYQSYGGFTKGTAAKKLSVAGFKTTNYKLPKITGVKVAKQRAFKAPTTRKLAVSSLPKISSRKRTAVV